MNKEFFKNMHEQIGPSERVEQELRRKIEQRQKAKRQSKFIQFGVVIAACLLAAILVIKMVVPDHSFEAVPNPTSPHNNHPVPPGNETVTPKQPNDGNVDTDPTPSTGNGAGHEPEPDPEPGPATGEDLQPDQGIGGQTPLLDMYDMKFTSFAYPFWQFAGGNDEFILWADNKLKELVKAANGDLTVNTDPTILDLINDFNISKEDFIRAANEAAGGLEPSFTAEEIDILYSKDMDKINETFMNPAALLVNGDIYPMQWLIENSYEQWKDIGIEPAAIEAKLQSLDYHFHGETLETLKTKINGYKDFLG